jgi:hypothetical protein
MNDKAILADLYDVLSSQQKVIFFILANHQALIDTLSNEPSLQTFNDRFEENHAYTSKHPKGGLFEALSAMQSKLDAIGETLKRDTGGWHN